MVRHALTRLGAYTPSSFIRLSNSALNYLEAGRWLGEHGHHVRKRVRSRESLYDQLAPSIANRKVLYLEMGVASGVTMRYWSQMLRNPESMLHGFDSFEGLPEHWGGTFVKGIFDLNGNIPVFHDPRIRLFKGWFKDTLPQYQIPESYDVMVLHLDADIYSSTICALERFRDAITPGTYLIFDEFVDRHHELRAFKEFVQSTNYRFALVAATRTLVQVAFQRI